MTPKDKALELILKYLRIGTNTNQWFSTNIAKQCSLIAVDEIIKTDTLIDEDTFVMTPSYLQYWQEVKQELEKL